MKVLIDGHMIGTREGGNERYTKNLFNALCLIRPLLLVNKSYPNDKSSIVSLNFDNDLYRLLYFIPALVKSRKINIVHSNYIAPFYKNCKCVVTVHDFSFKKYPQFYSLKEKAIFNLLLSFSLARADAIIVPSKFTKKEVIKFYPRYKEKIFITYEAVDRVFHFIERKKARNMLSKQYPNFRNFLLTINSKNPKKNINKIIEAYLRLKNKFFDLQLVIIGGAFNIKKEFLKIDTIVILDHINDEELNILYNTCLIFIYFSVYEGFGLPILEALKCRALVIASDIEVHHEIAKNSILYADSNNSADLKNKITLFLINKNKAERIRKEGQKISQLYSWEKTARQTLEVYKFVMKDENSDYRY